jgi:hypothetical protein
MENVNAMFALMAGMAISVSLALLLEKAVFTSVMRMMMSTPMMTGSRERHRPLGSSTDRANLDASFRATRNHYPL